MKNSNACLTAMVPRLELHSEVPKLIGNIPREVLLLLFGEIGQFVVGKEAFRVILMFPEVEKVEDYVERGSMQIVEWYFSLNFR
jgi:hypothetical protein